MKTHLEHHWFIHDYKESLTSKACEYLINGALVVGFVLNVMVIVKMVTK